KNQTAHLQSPRVKELKEGRDRQFGKDHIRPASVGWDGRFEREPVRLRTKPFLDIGHPIGIERDIELARIPTAVTDPESVHQSKFEKTLAIEPIEGIEWDASLLVALAQQTDGIDAVPTFPKARPVGIRARTKELKIPAINIVAVQRLV